MGLRGAAVGLLFAVLATRAAPRLVADPAPNRVRWQAWEPAAFERARAERRIVLGVVSTSWCHWCHVMQRETYADPRVERAIARAFLPLKADGDARPDLAQRLRKFHWPATAFYAPDGTPVLALRGYRSADELLAILADVEQRVRRGGPYPGFDTPDGPRAPATPPDGAALEALRSTLIRQLDATYDERHNGWGKGQKYPLTEPVLWGLRRGLTHPQDPRPLRRAMDTLAASEALIDPVWGGMFQYSVGPGWDAPHYEKIMAVNAGALACYARAFELSGNLRWKRDAEALKRWFERFLSREDDVFYASQDAEVAGREATAYHRLDEAGRLAIGVPRVDKSVYARENGQAIQAWLACGRALGDAGALTRARAAVSGLEASHFDAERGLFRHAAADASGRFYLLDQAEMGLALVALLQLIWTPAELGLLERLLAGMQAAFAAPGGGWFDVATVEGGRATAHEPMRSLEGGAQAARFVLQAATLLGDDAAHRRALAGIAALADPAWLADHGRYVGDLLLAVEEALAPRRVVTIHGAGGFSTHALRLVEVVQRAQRRDPDLVLRVARDREPSGAPFAVLCRPDGSCSDPIEEPLALDLALGG